MRAWPPASVLVLLLGSFLLMPAAASGQSFTYATECVSNVDNATVHVPAGADPSLPGGTPVAAGDTLAVYTADGTCAGYGVWQSGSGVTLAAAGSDSIAVSEDGYASGASLQFEVFDVSEGTAVDVDSAAAFASCDSVGVPVCAEGVYEPGTFHQVTSFQPDSTETVTLALAEGWNFVSVPLQSDVSFGTLFPECSQGFRYVPGEGYSTIQADETLSVGTGAAAQCQPDSTSVTGTEASSSIEVDAGWNLIGGVEDTVAVSAVTTSPSGILASDFFKLPPGEGYTAATALHPGEGYWIKTAEAGTLDVSGGAGSLVAGAAGAEPGETMRLSFVDAEGQRSTLRLTQGLTDEERSRSELPPVPPGEIFDVRFASGHEAASIGEGAASDAQVRIQGAAFPVEVRLEAEGLDQRITLSAGDKEFALSEDRPTAQIQQSTRRIGVAAAPSPQAFRLGKASPNPLRGRAELEYALPKQAAVEITVYDVLGRRVARLVDEKRRTGVHKARVDASTLPSGKYFVRMRAGSFRQTRPLTVVR